MCRKTRCVCARDGDHKLQRLIRAAGGTSVYNENRLIDGDPGSFGSGCMSVVQISGYDKCRSEAAIEGILCKDPGD